MKIEIGSYIGLLDSTEKGRVVAFDKEKRLVYFIADDGMEMEAPVHEIVVYPDPTAKIKLREIELVEKPVPIQKAPAPKQNSDVLDLHAERIGIPLQGLSPQEIQKHQMNTFRLRLQQQLKVKKPFTVIHGFGNGSLRQAIHNHLRQLQKQGINLTFLEADPILYGQQAATRITLS